MGIDLTCSGTKGFPRAKGIGGGTGWNGCVAVCAECERLKEKIEIILDGIDAPEFKSLEIVAASLRMKLNLLKPENAYLCGWEAAMLECGEVLSKPNGVSSKLKKTCPDCGKPLNYTIQWHKHEHLKGKE